MLVDASMELLFLFWKLLLVTPIMGTAVNTRVLEAHYPVALMMICSSSLIAALCFIYRQSTRLQHIMPLFCAGYIGVTLCYHSYLVGNIPYAPLFQYTHAPFPEQASGWLISTTVLYMMVLSVIVLVFDAIITAWWKQSEEILLLSQTDSLTKLYNRRSLNTYLQQVAKHAHSTCLVLMDLDHFKSINDTYGHLVGDEILQNTAALLSQHVRQGDWVGRYGGEEFIMVLPNTALPQAVEVAERCRQAIRTLHVARWPT